MKIIKKTLALLLCFSLIFNSIVFVSADEYEITDEYNNVCCEDISEMSDSELYDMWLSELLYKDRNISYFGVLARERLDTIPKKLYDFLKNEINLILETENDTEETYFTVTSDMFTDWGAEVSFKASTPQDAYEQFMLQINIENVIEALLHDCPSKLFWYDKVTGLASGGSVTSYLSGEYTITKVVFRFSVTENFRAENYDAKKPALDTAGVAKAVAATEFAHAFVNDAEITALSDYEKLMAYMEAICILVDYDYNSALSGDFSVDNSPWQIINVFDGDESTKAVCEGYAKAFQYLCDISTFNYCVYSTTVIGYLSGISHMWNIVTIGANNYIVDVTNSDTGMAGENGEMFLKGAEGSISDGYYLNGEHYVYSSDTKGLWGTDADSVLNISSVDYDPENIGLTHDFVNNRCTICSYTGGICGDNLKWVLEDNVLRIYGEGEMYDFAEDSSPWFTYKDEITIVTVEEGATNIGENAFFGLDRAVKFELPSTIKIIYKNAFRSCESLESIIIPENTEKIDDGAFWGCNKLSEIIFPESINSIGNYVLYNAENLESIKFMGDAPEIADNAFMGVVANAYHFEDNSTWTDENRLQYGGEITWGTVNLCDFVGHEEVKDEAVAPTCTETGLTEGSHCEVCGDVITAQEVTDANGHSYETVVYAPDCENGGYTYFICSVCGYNYEGEYTSALGHNYETKVTEPTCTERGYTEYNCLTCGENFISDYVASEGHDYNKEVTSPTCTEGGYTSYVCAYCGDNYVADYTEAKGHSYSTVITPPACTEKGYTTYTCVSCGDNYVADYTDAEGHSYEGKVTEPTCTEKGFTTYTCSVCSDSYVADYTDAKGHSEKAVTGREPTCTEEGFAEGKVCSVCGIVLVSQGTIPAKGHSYTSKITAPTCTEKGYTTYTCSSCGDTYKADYVEVISHNYSKKVTSPTCTDKGFTTYTCTACSHTYIGDYVNAKGHTEETIKGYDVTCTAKGLSDGKKCTVCGTVTVNQTEIAAKGHSYTTKFTAPTCTEKGYTTYTCSVCGDNYKANYINAKGHSEVIVKGYAATCTEKGLTDGKTCSVCGTVTVQQTEIAAKGHSYSSKVTAPTCTEKGYTTYTCVSCGDTYKADYVNANGHAYTSKVTKPTCTSQGYTIYTCTVCGYSHKSDYVNAYGHKYSSTMHSPTCTSDGYTTYICNVCNYKFNGNVVKSKGHTYSNRADATCNVCDYIRVAPVKSVPMYRMYDPNSSEHFYTGSTEERDILVAAGWQYEGVGFNFPVAGAPVHRLYEPLTGEHLYTMDEAEKEKLLSEGWQYEGVAFNSAESDEIPQYRLHNPNATRGAYHFTGSEEERDLLISFGWEYQGIGWYSCLR